MSGLAKLFVDPSAHVTCPADAPHETTTYLIPEDGFGIVQLLLFMLFYGYILSYASNLIAEGSEMLLLVLDPGVVGGFILPVMGAVPDGAIVLFSGLGANPQEQLAVGIGTLAGSTIMLLTVPWSMCTAMGRVDLGADGLAKYRGSPKLSKGWNLRETGTSPQFETLKPNILIMLGTAVTYLIIQGPSFKYGNDKDAVREESPWALTGLILSFVLFVAYSLYQVFGEAALSEQEQKKMARLRDIAKQGGIGIEALISDAAFRRAGDGAVEGDLRRSLTSASAGESKMSEQDRKNLDVFMSALFTHVANLVEADEYVDAKEAEILIRTMVGRRAFERMKVPVPELVRQYGSKVSGHYKMNQAEFKSMFLNIFSLYSEAIAEQRSFGNQVLALLASIFPCCQTRVSRSSGDGAGAGAGGAAGSRSFRGSLNGRKSGEDDEEEGGAPRAPRKSILATMHDEASRGSTSPEEELVEEEEDEEEEEEEEEEEDMAGMSRSTILFKAFSTMLLGVIVVTIFSDPLVDVLSTLGNRINVPAFYVSFIVTPLVSNASEFISSMVFAAKKTRKSITMTYSALLGAASMNNTFCLCIFLALVYFRKLDWNFSAEVTAILVIEILVAIIAYRRVHQLWTAIAIGALFPISIVLVYLLENVAHWD